MIENIRHSNLIEGINDRHEDKLSLYAWHWLEKQETITQPVLLELHRLITCNQLSKQESGHYRDIMVTVGGHIAPAPLIAKVQIVDWMKDLMRDPASLDPRTMHIRFEKIHPFVDGNGRTGRMLMWWHERKLGREPTLLRSNEADRHEYYQWFREEI